MLPPELEVEPAPELPVLTFTLGDTLVVPGAGAPTRALKPPNASAQTRNATSAITSTTARIVPTPVPS